MVIYGKPIFQNQNQVLLATKYLLLCYFSSQELGNVNYLKEALIFVNLLGSLIISNEHGLVLTIDSDNNIIARKTDGLFNHDWSLLETGKLVKRFYYKVTCTFTKS